MEATVYFFCVVALVSSIAAAWSIVAFLFGWIPDLRAKYRRDKLYAVTVNIAGEEKVMHVVAISKAEASKECLQRVEWIGRGLSADTIIANVRAVPV